MWSDYEIFQDWFTHIFPSMLWSSFYFSTVWHVCGVNGRRKWFDLSQNGRCLTGHLYTARGMIRIFQNQLHWYFCDPKSPWYLVMNGHNHYLTSLNQLVLLMLKGDPKIIGTKHGIESTVILQLIFLFQRYVSFLSQKLVQPQSL